MAKSKKISVVAIVGGVIGILTFFYAIFLGASIFSQLSLFYGEGVEFVSPIKSIELLLEMQMPDYRLIAFVEIFTVFLSVLILVESILALLGGIIGNKGMLTAAKVLGIVLIPFVFVTNILEIVLWIAVFSSDSEFMKQLVTLPQFLPYLSLAVSILTIVASKKYNKALASNNVELTSN